MIFTPKNPAKIASYFDHTALKATVTREEIAVLCEEARRCSFFAVCVNPTWVEFAAERLEGSTVLPITVVGFPLGATLSESKATEADLAIEAGAQEIDMVLNLSAVKSRDWVRVEDDIREVVSACGDVPVKVILETCYLENDEIVAACRASVEAGAAFVKTSTGFGPFGATEDHVRLMRQTVGPGTGVKASGGIRSWQDMGKMIDAGASRIGSSNSVKILEEYLARGQTGGHDSGQI